MLLILFFTFILGAVIGSFLNVCIYRIPEGQSIVSPPSRCPQCGTRIRWYQNVPLLSYLLLGGHCGSCRARISPRYPLVECLTAVLFVLVVWRFGLQPFVPVLWLLVAALVTITFIDLDHQIIPDVISLPGIAIGFLCSFLIPWVDWLDSLLGILFGGGSLLLIAWGYEKLTGKEGMGGGDIKLLAMLGAFLGWRAILPIVFFSSLIGTLVGVPVMLVSGKGRRLAIPFGPFLALGALVYLFWGPQLIRWYLHLFSP